MIIGIDMGGTTIDAGVVVNGKIEKRVSIDTNANQDKDFILNNLYKLIDQLFSDDVKAIGIGVPGAVELKTGSINKLDNIPSWKNVPLKQLLENKYKVPVIVNNDANCFVVGEKHFGLGRDYKNLVAVILGTGLGAGIIINNKLYCGATCAAGEFGAIPYLDSNFDDYTSGQFFIKKHGVSGKDLFNRAKAGDKIAIKIFEKLGFHIGKVLAAIVYSVNPEIIILGASVSKAYEFFRISMMKSLKQSISEMCYNNLKIEAVTDTNDKAILGAAALYYDSLN